MCDALAEVTTRYLVCSLPNKVKVEILAIISLDLCFSIFPIFFPLPFVPYLLRKNSVLARVHSASVHITRARGAGVTVYSTCLSGLSLDNVPPDKRKV